MRNQSSGSMRLPRENTRAVLKDDAARRLRLRTGDVLVLCTDGLWSVMSQHEVANYLTSAPILKTAPQMMREAEKRGCQPQEGPAERAELAEGPGLVRDDRHDEPAEVLVTNELGQQAGKRHHSFLFSVLFL